MRGPSGRLALDRNGYVLSTALKRLVLAQTCLLALTVSAAVRAQDLDAEPLFGSISLSTGFTSTPFTAVVSPGGDDGAWALDDACTGYMRFAQPDFVLSYQAGNSPLGVFAMSDLDTTMAINDPAGNWHCNDDSPQLSGTNSGIQFDSPLSGHYQIWVGRYDSEAESTTTMLAITEADKSEWASLPIGMEDAVYAASFDTDGNIVFGDDSSGFSNDGECDDPRFQGPGMAVGTSSNHLFKDASDCRSQFQAGLVSLIEAEDMNLGGSGATASFGINTDLFGGDSNAFSPTTLTDAGPVGEVAFALWQAFQAIPGEGAGPMPLPFGMGELGAPAYDRAAMTELTGIDFGDDSGPFTGDGECDDPRFEGPGAAGVAFDGAEFTDAGDCSSQYLQGALTYRDPTANEAAPVVDSTGVAFGDDSGMFAEDGECDDPRFEGPGAAMFSSEELEMRDASDCRSLFESGRVSLIAAVAASPAAPATASAPVRVVQTAPSSQETYTVGIPRGDIHAATRADGSIYASGTVYGEPVDSDDRRSMTRPTTGAPSPAPMSRAADTGIDFGDNGSTYANDGECDDPRFEGDGAAAVNFDEDRGRDANDCRAAYDAGTIHLIGN